MWRDLFANMSLFVLPILAMCIFVAIFCTVLLRVSQRARAPEYDRMASLPLADDHQENT
ncbi:MAG: hypothetical protein IT456_27930 [Planctomycetes bacterium]|jgi:hypothetical protein|nr:hypothetical protein [Planctomycetota bacterium]